jgi:hypothetical protein
MSRIHADLEKWRGGAITLQFSEPMEPSTLMQVLSNDPKQLSTSTTILLLYGGLTSTAQVPAKVSCADTFCRTVTLDPDARLAKRKTYSLKIERGGAFDGHAVQDQAGNIG